MIALISTDASSSSAMHVGHRLDYQMVSRSHRYAARCQQAGAVANLEVGFIIPPLAAAVISRQLPPALLHHLHDPSKINL